MVDIVLLAASCTLELCHPQQRNLMRMDNRPNLFRDKANRVGWISRKQS
jgi:hypothetical protein